MIGLALRSAVQGPGGWRALYRLDTCGMLATYFELEERPTFQRSLTTAVRDSIYNLEIGEKRKQARQHEKLLKWPLSSSTCSQKVDPTALSKRLAVQVGALLKIDLSGTQAGINITAGENLEEIAIQPIWTEFSDGGTEWKSLDITLLENKLSLQKSTRWERAKMQLSKLLVLTAKIPARWCSLDVETSEGPVYIQNVREATLRVITGGGDVKLGESKGGEAYIASHGGDFEANVLQASSVVSTLGGNLLVTKVQGSTIKLDSGGGQIVLGSLYGNHVTVQSRGGALEANHIQAEDMAHLSSDGGPITIRGFDGNAAVMSGGGRVELQLSEHAQEVSVEAADGDVILSLSSKMTAQLKFAGPPETLQHEGVLRPTSEPGLYQYVGSGSGRRRPGLHAGWRGSENAYPSVDGEAVTCRIVVCTAGELSVRQKGWLDLV